MSKENGKLIWLKGACPDQWVLTRAFVKVQGVQTIHFRAFLPGNTIDEPKSITIHHGESLICEAQIRRKKVTEFSVKFPTRQEDAILAFDSSYPEPKNGEPDGRALGFLCVGYRLDDGDWMQIPEGLFAADELAGLNNGFNINDYLAIEGRFDPEFYRKQFGRNDFLPQDLIAHFLIEGVKQERDPCAWFSTSYYLKRYPDVAAGGINPFVHYVTQGRNEGRIAVPPREVDREATGAGSATMDR